MVDNVNKAEMAQRTCVRCHETKALDSFYDRAAKCIPCHNAYSREYAKANPRRGRDYPGEQKIRKRKQAFQYRMGITEDERNEIFASQDNACAICRRTESGGPGWCTDHDHSCCPEKARSCGRCIRGVLCYSCNTLLGHAKDSIETLRAAIDYLERSYARG